MREVSKHEPDFKNDIKKIVTFCTFFVESSKTLVGKNYLSVVLGSSLIGIIFLFALYVHTYGL